LKEAGLLFPAAAWYSRYRSEIPAGPDKHTKQKIIQTHLTVLEHIVLEPKDPIQSHKYREDKSVSIEIQYKVIPERGYTMENIKKIVCFCGSGLGSSFMMEMNCKKALKNLGIDGVTVEHTTLADVHSGMADLLICGNDLLPQAQKAGKAVGLKNLVSLPEMTEKLKEAFGI
jgi:PTS system ascorbate-specific IIB component